MALASEADRTNARAQSGNPGLAGKLLPGPPLRVLHAVVESSNRAVSFSVEEA